MNVQHTRPKARLDGLFAGLILGLAFLLLCVWHLWHKFQIGLAYSVVTASLIHGGNFGDVLPIQLAAFAAAAIAAHLALGLLAWGLARLTESAFGVTLKWRRLTLVTVWMFVLAALVLAANTTWFPASNFTDEDSWLLAQWSGLRPIYLPLAAIAVLIVVMCARVWARARPTPRRQLAVAATTAVLALSILIIPSGPTRSAAVAADFHSPHVVIVGIDSLRNDRVGGDDHDSLTPRLDEFLAGAHRFTDTTTPLARTYAAWTSILTGRHPVTTNARDNLIPRALVREGDTLGDVLTERGYHTVYATDEVRFANFDQSYGFAQLITPPMGAIDFLLGKVGDLPVINLITQTPVGAWLFPSNRANRAAYITYRPEQFTNRLRHELVFDRPSFLAAHLTLSHWPYSWADMPTPTTPQEYRPAYEHAVAGVDRQFGDLMAFLGEKGVLENAIVIVLSDHGEALGWESDTMLRKVGTGDEIWNSIWGHGTSVMSPHQYQVLFAIRAFGRAQIPGEPSDHAWPVSLEDIRPTLQEMVTGDVPAAVDGVSLLPYLSGAVDPAGLQQRIRYTETGWNPKLVLAGKYNESGLINEGAVYYELARGSGWMQLRADRLPELIAKKQRAALTSDLLLAAVPDLDDGSMEYWLTDRHAPLPRRMTTRPDPATEPEAARLWDALQARFPGELPVASATPPT